jgi:hypothetical protein
MSEKLEFLARYSHRYVAGGANVELLPSPTHASAPIPENWISLLKQDRSSRINSAIHMWQDIVEQEMSNTISYFTEFLTDIELLRVGTLHYLLYSIRQLDKDQVLFYVGGNPLQRNYTNNPQLAADWNRLPIKIRDFYEQLHDGFFYWPSRTMGLDAVEKVIFLGKYRWPIQAQLQPEIDLSCSHGFFTNGEGSYISLETSHGSAMLWDANQPPKTNINFWDWIDEWTTIGFE